MKSKGAKVGRSFSPNLFGAHRYTTVGGMCALRGVLQTAVACLRQSKGEMTFPLRCRKRTYPIVYFVPMSIPKCGILMETKSESAIPPRYCYIQIMKREVLSWLRKN